MWSIGPRVPRLHMRKLPALEMRSLAATRHDVVHRPLCPQTAHAETPCTRDAVSPLVMLHPWTLDARRTHSCPRRGERALPTHQTAVSAADLEEGDGVDRRHLGDGLLHDVREDRDHRDAPVPDLANLQGEELLGALLGDAQRAVV